LDDVTAAVQLRDRVPQEGVQAEGLEELHRLSADAEREYHYLKILATRLAANRHVINVSQSERRISEICCSRFKFVSSYDRLRVIIILRR